MLEFTVFTLWKFSEAMHFASYLLLLFQEFCLFTLQSAIYQPQLLLVSLEIVKFQLSDLIELCLFSCVIVSALILSWLGVMSPPQSSSSIYFKNFCFDPLSNVLEYYHSKTLKLAFAFWLQETSFTQYIGPWMGENFIFLSLRGQNYHSYQLNNSDVYSSETKSTNGFTWCQVQTDKTSNELKKKKENFCLLDIMIKTRYIFIFIFQSTKKECSYLFHFQWFMKDYWVLYLHLFLR